MKKFLYTLLFFSMVFVSCVDTQKSEIEKLAIETFKKSLLEDSKSVTIDNIKSVFTGKNLCIINAEISGIEELNKVEYIFLSLDGKDYEAFHDLNDDSIFVSESTFNKISKGTIYENQDYATAILFRSVSYMNSNGREVGNHNKDFIINSPLKTGLWEICDIADDFGDITGGKCLRIIGKGTYSSDYESDEMLIALLFIYKNGLVNMQLYKEKKLIDDISGSIKIKDGEGGVHEIHFRSDHFGQIAPSSDAGKVEFGDIIEKGGTISVIAKESKFLNFAYSNKTYNFKFNLDGFKKAMSFIRPSERDVSIPEYEEIDSNVEEFNHEDLDEKMDISIPEIELTDSI